jgi:hypothetical protein
MSKTVPVYVYCRHDGSSFELAQRIKLSRPLSRPQAVLLAA